MLYPLGICVLCVIMFPLSLLCLSALLWWVDNRTERNRKDLGVICTV